MRKHVFRERRPRVEARTLRWGETVERRETLSLSRSAVAPASSGTPKLCWSPRQLHPCPPSSPLPVPGDPQGPVTAGQLLAWPPATEVSEEWSALGPSVRAEGAGHCCWRRRREPSVQALVRKSAPWQFFEPFCKFASCQATIFAYSQWSRHTSVTFFFGGKLWVGE